MDTASKKMTAGSPARLIILFTIPLLLGNLAQQLYYMCNLFFLSRASGMGDVAAVGGSQAVMNLIVGFSTGMASGVAVVTAQRFGAEDEDATRKSFATSIFLCFAAGIVLTALGLFCVGAALRLMGTPAGITAGTRNYLTVMLCGLCATMMLTLFANMLRAVGDSKSALLFYGFSFLLNIALDYAFVVLLGKGAKGAAAATVLAQSVCAVMCFWYIRHRVRCLRVQHNDFSLPKSMRVHEVWQHLRIGLPMGVQSSVISIGAVGVQTAVNALGADAVAAFASAERFDMLTLAPLMSFGIAIGTYTAQNYGAQNWQRITKGVKTCAVIALGYSILTAFLNLFAGDAISRFLSPDSAEVATMIKTYLAIDAAGFCVLALLFIFRYSFQGMGRSAFPTAAGFVELAARLFAAFVLAPKLGFAGVCAANPLAWVCACVPLGAVFLLAIHKRAPRGRER